MRSSRLRTLRIDPAAARAPRDTGWFSLAGAQPKTALIFDGRRWGVPRGPTPTTHILKPPIDEFRGHAENEHLCLSLTRALGLPAAKSDVRRFEDEVVIVVERYDRLRTADSIRRLHQEDMCQILGLPPTKKYQNEGGPGCAEISAAIRMHSGAPEEDTRTFARASLLNWIIGGTDAHAKNFSMLIGAGGRARLAPLYDVASTLPYGFDPRRLRLATRIGGTYRLEDITSRHWARFAVEARLSAAAVLDMGRDMAATLSDAFDRTLDEARAGELEHPILEEMADLFRQRSQRCARILEAAPT